MLSVESRDGIAVIRIEHGKVNALDIELLDALTRTLREHESQRAVVLTGSGSVFSAGVDLKRFLAGGSDYAEAFFHSLDDAFVTAFTLPIPVVAAVNGHAIAGGCVLVAAADVAIMSAGTIGLPELSVGVPFPKVTVEIMRYRLGSRLAGVVHSARGLRPDEAQQSGLVDTVVEPEGMLDAAVARARVLAATPRSTFAAIKASLRAPAIAAFADRPSAREVAALWSSSDVLESVARVVGG